MSDIIRYSLFLPILVFFFGKSNSQTITQLSFFAPLISTFDMDYIDNHLIISQQYLIIVDVTDPTDPQMVGSALYPGSYAYQVAAEGNHVYMAEGGNGLFAVYDVTSFALPFLTGSVSIPETAFLLNGDLEPNGNFVYMTGFDTLYVLDVSNPSAPFVSNTLEIENVGLSGAGSMGIIGNSLFITTVFGMQIFDISNPANPFYLTLYPNSHAYQNGISVDTINHRIFLPWLTALQTHLGYDAIDVTDPSSPIYLFSDSTSFGGGDFGQTAYYNNVLFISKGGGVNAFDVSEFNHHYVTSFTGPNVANSSVALDIRDSVFYNARGGGFEVLLYSGGFPTSVQTLLHHNESLMLSPNPVSSANGELEIYYKGETKNATITLYNSLGISLKSLSHFNGNNTSIKMNIPNTLSSGVYFVTLTDGTRTITNKLLVE